MAEGRKLVTTPPEVTAAAGAVQGLPPRVEDPQTRHRAARPVETQAARDPATRLGHPDLTPLVDELVRRYSSGRAPVRVTVPDLGDRGGARLADLLGSDRLLPAGSMLLVARLAAALGVDGAPGVRTLLVGLRGPLGDRRADRHASADARTALWAHLESSARHLRVFPDAEAAPRWIARLGAAGVPQGDVEAHRAVLDRAVRCLSRLPAEEPVSLAGLAADITGSAHGLDPGRRLTRAVLDGLSIAFGLPAPTDAEGARAVWERAGVVPDPLSSTVLSLGLRPSGDHPVAAFLRAAADASEPVVLTLRQLQHWPTSARFDAGGAYLVENPSLVADAAAHRIAAPLLCSSGRPSLAVVSLVRRLVGEGAIVRQHADFDPAGLEITRWLAARAGSVPWLMDAGDYRQAIAAGRPTTDLVGVVGETPWDTDLAPAMRVAGRAVHEEVLRKELLEAIGDR